ncbi:type II toxin-antitoxin system RatA family toxin [Candidatus Liberibacter sp.]|uniref:type II toxin-antitoxin system RatA family toxin n=1 Tax=Candidatus Liberibacter sp. TaxID=34022 RepID=UPI0015F5D917|nr:type II toxin-antitoxin system RatA family toxin [Candidatus Liberibacter sp.]MBA5723805.1 type II toxin-antitoxin system RatA family toxin [Candidatus Liberibacter sp.]
MHHFKSNRVVSYNSEQMFDLVADVEKYPQFVPLCKKIVVYSHEQIDKELSLVAGMTIGYMGIQETFITQVQLQKHKKRIFVKHIENLFRFLENHWHFEETPSGKCVIHFSIKYELKNILFDKALKLMFDRTFLSFAAAFEKRAQEIYQPSLSRQ